MRVGIGSGTTVAALIPALAERALRSAASRRPTRRLPRRAPPASRSRRSTRSPSSTSRSTAPTRSRPGRGWSRAAGGRTRARRSSPRRRERFVVIASGEKRVERVGPPIPLELLAFGLPATLRRLGPAVPRGGPPSPDGGVIADWTGPVEDPAELAAPPRRRARRRRPRPVRAGVRHRHRGRGRGRRRASRGARPPAPVTLRRGQPADRSTRLPPCPASSSDRSCGTSTTGSPTVWLQTDGPCEVEILGARDRTWCVDGMHFALVVIEGLTPGRGPPPTRCASTARPCGRRPDPRFPPSTIRLLEPGGRRDVVFGSCRITRPHEPPYVLRATSRTARAGHRRAADLRAARRARRRRRRVPGHAPDARRPDLRRPALAGAQRAVRRARAPARRARGRAGRLRRVRARVRRGVVGPRDPLAALDGPGDDGLRRPRDPRRVAHLAGLARRDERRAVVRRPHPGRADGLLGVPAPRQPLARPARRGRPATTRSARPTTPRRCSPRAWTRRAARSATAAGASPATSATPGWW